MLKDKSLIAAVVIIIFSVVRIHAQTADSLRWREVFTDPELAALIDTALVHNKDLRTASLRVEQAHASLSMSRMAILPSLSIGAEGCRESPLERGGNGACHDTVQYREEYRESPHSQG